MKNYFGLVYDEKLKSLNSFKNHLNKICVQTLLLITFTQYKL